MGFGNGYSNKTDRGFKKYSNSQVAHVWNAQSERGGQSDNGNFYFRQRSLYSYGTHFVVGYIMPDGVALLNADSYSVSTSGHQSAASFAVSNRDYFRVSDLTKLESILDAIAQTLTDVHASGEFRKSLQTRVRVALKTHYLAMSARRYEAGASRYRWNSETLETETIEGGVELGAYLAALVGLPATAWPKIQRDAIAAAAKEAKREAAAKEQAAIDRALWLADKTPREFRDLVARYGAEYSDSSLVSLGKELKRARGLMLKAKSGKLAAASRLATIRQRIKLVDSNVQAFEERNRPRQARAKLARDIETVRAWINGRPALDDLTTSRLDGLRQAGLTLAACGRTSALKAAGATLAANAAIGYDCIIAENTKRRELEREREKLAAAERIALWYAGERVGSVYFDAATGGAALRIVGDTLQTSHGAEVPLAHAIKVFRFVKLCRDKGETWMRNGKTIRVGHFQVDSVAADGSFVAGCHAFTWPEIERVAKAANLFDVTPSAEAVEPSRVAA
jgi:hypothetical protein